MKKLTQKQIFWGLAGLAGANLLSYASSYLFAALAPSIQRDLGLNDAVLGALGSAFVWGFLLVSPFAGHWVTRLSRRKIIALCILIWSVATIGLGFFGSVLALFAMRFLIGASQSAFVSIAPTVVVDTAEKKSEAKALSYFYAALPLGTAVGFIFGGLVSLYFGWRAALLYMGLVGLPLAAAMLWTKHRAHGKIAHHFSWFEELEVLEHNPRYLWSVLGYAAQTFTLGGFVFWIPNFMQRVHGMSQAQGTITFGALVVITGFVGTILGGRLADRIKSRDKLKGYLNLSTLVTAIAIPFAFLLVMTTSPAIFYISMALVQIAIFATFPIINTLFLESTNEDVRGTAIGMANFSGRLLGDMLSIWLVGAISQATGNLKTAMLVLPVALIVNWAAWMMARNTHKA